MEEDQIREVEQIEKLHHKNKDSKRFKFLPIDFFEKIEFNKVRNILISMCKGEEGKVYYQNLDFLASASAINHELAKTKIYFSSFAQDIQIPFGDYYDISRDLFLLSKENYMLDIEAIFRVNASIRLGNEIIHFFLKNKDYSLLNQIVDQVEFEKTLVNLIDKILDEEGNVRPNASPELLRITKNINSKMRELDKEFDNVVKYYKERNMLTDTTESYRNGRRVLTVPAEKKRMIKGTIHDESATGKTVFLEPETVMRLNNDLFEMENDHRTEINRIIRQLCKDLRAFIPTIENYHKLIVQFDIIGARARWAKLIEGEFPIVISEPSLNFRSAFHPLLKLKNDSEKKKTVSFDLELHGNNRILLLSGPNAGGKSILMKSVILLQTMIQCGLPIPVHPESKPGFFKHFMADIGDQQSIENDLSTYSSRLKIMSEALRKANKNTLLVIDEFGSGTDPKFGGALAESMLNSFNKLGVFGVVTTHYSNLKMFAYKSKGIVNGAMVFNEEALQPTYEMRIGKPGSSFALEIADKSGIPKSVMKYARFKTGADTTKIEDLLIGLQREKAETEAKLEQVIKKEKELERLIGTYNQLYKELDIRRKKVKIEAKEVDLRNFTEQNKAFENLVRELKEEKKLDEALAKAAEIKKEKERIYDEVLNLESSVFKQINYDVNQFKPGDFVKIANGTDVGVITWIKKNKVEVRFGNLSITTKLKDLVPAKEPIEINKRRSVIADISSNSQTHTKLDIRGMSREDGMRMTQEFLDKALMSSVHELQIIHGLGSGVLKKEVFRIAREYSDIKEIFHPEFEAGGEGVTIIKL